MLFFFYSSHTHNVGYPRLGFKYSLNRFAQEGDRTRPTADQDRTRRALSDALITFPN